MSVIPFGPVLGAHVGLDKFYILALGAVPEGGKTELVEVLTEFKYFIKKKRRESKRQNLK